MNKKIVASTVDPFIFISRLQPYSIDFTANIKSGVGGLSYGLTFVQEKLISNLRKLYETIYNTVLLKDVLILFGVGSTQLMNAYFYAVAKKEKRETTVGFFNNNPPTFDFIKEIVDVTKNCKFVEYGEKDIEVVVCPNNPNGALFNVSEELLKKYVMFDSYYDVPIYTGKFEPASPYMFDILNKNMKSVVISSFSGFGLPGARCGYALVRDSELFENMKQFLYASSITNSSNMAVINTAMERHFLDRTFYTGPMNRLQKRREQMLAAFQKNNINCLNETFDAPYLYSDKSAEYWLEKFNVEVESGDKFNDLRTRSRLSLMIAELDWNELLKRM